MHRCSWMVFLLMLLTSAARAAAADVQQVAVKHEGVEVRAAVAPADAMLAHTTQLLPTGTVAAPAAADDAARQVGSLLKQLDELLGKVGASRETLVRVNLYATTNEAAASGRAALEQAVKCPVAPVVTELPQPGALVSIE